MRVDDGIELDVVVGIEEDAPMPKSDGDEGPKAKGLGKGLEVLPS